MSSIRKDPQSNLYRIQFRFSGRQFQRSLKTKVLKEARAIVARVDETIRLIMLGRLKIPDHVNPAAFILSDGNLTESKLSCKDVLTLSELFSLYDECIPGGAMLSRQLRFNCTQSARRLPIGTLSNRN